MTRVPSIEELPPDILGPRYKGSPWDPEWQKHFQARKLKALELLAKQAIEQSEKRKRQK